MTKVLTIDFDILMWESLPLYNNLVQDDWKTLTANFDLLKYVQFDGELYNYLTQMILKQTKHIKKENVHFITSHHRVIKYLPLNDLIEITNIDHHHDIQYNEIEPEDDLNCGNWIKYAYEHGYAINQYNWIHNSNSIQCYLDKNNYLSKQDTIENFDLTMEDYDIIIICLSPPWVPPKYRPLFYCWIDMLNRIYDTTFTVDD